MEVTYGTYSFDMWRETPIPMYMSVYYFNCTNAEEIMDNSYNIINATHSPRPKPLWVDFKTKRCPYIFFYHFVFQIETSWPLCLERISWEDQHFIFWRWRWLENKLLSEEILDLWWGEIKWKSGWLDLDPQYDRRAGCGSYSVKAWAETLICWLWP